ncbi:MAG: DUF86 domain-containing protein [Candidatus Cloacimonetes bacterium]|nr:DUF86 domain-containing protein [Candidatus Cloacimonadota bacterium]MDY0173444.1 DUF86 domain-containing protein [Candidatus Cloacimonadaceae bacterium]
MNNRDDFIYVQHILEAIEQISAYIDGIDKAAFRTDRMRQDAVIRQLEIIGEATKNISADLRNAYPDIPWKDMAGMRDVLIHHYFGVDIGAVWRTATEDAIALEQQISEILQ